MNHISDSDVSDNKDILINMKKGELDHLMNFSGNRGGK
jgi:hypothetical protein